MPKTEPFEKFSDAYDEWFDRNRDLYEAELRAVRQLMPPPGTEGVEVGVGTGRFAAPLGIKTGVEPSEKMVVKARAKGIVVLPGVAENLPIAEARFDVVLMVTTICFVDDIVASFREAFRVLKPGGCIIVGFINKESELGRQYADKKEGSPFYKYASFFSAPEVLESLEKAGFEIDTIRQTLIPGEPLELILDSFGKGAFVLIRGLKKKAG
jgi:SAM-dependent methyltransferase